MGKSTIDYYRRRIFCRGLQWQNKLYSYSCICNSLARWPREKGKTFTQEKKDRVFNVWQNAGMFFGETQRKLLEQFYRLPRLLQFFGISLVSSRTVIGMKTVMRNKGTSFLEWPNAEKVISDFDFLGTFPGEYLVMAWRSHLVSSGTAHRGTSFTFFPSSSDSEKWWDAESLEKRYKHAWSDQSFIPRGCCSAQKIGMEPQARTEAKNM